MPQNLPPFDRGSFRVLHGNWFGRVPGPLGCLLAIVLCPIGIVLALVMSILWLFGVGRGRLGGSVRRSTPEQRAREQATRRLVEAMALDETFTAEEARQAGVPLAGGATVDDLLADALERRWIEVRGDRLAVTKRGRLESAGMPPDLLS
jgi:hypothetical protein